MMLFCKRLLSLMLLATMVLMSLSAWAEEEDEVLESAVISGGTSMERATIISPSLLGYQMNVIVESQNTWFAFTNEAPNTYYIHLHMNSHLELENYKWNYLEVSIHDSKGKVYSTYENIVVKNDNILLPVDLPENSMFYVCLNRTVPTELTPISMSICDATHHLPSVESYLTLPVTCCQDGQRSYICQLCNQTCYATVIPATGHTLSDWGYYAEATCITAGLFGQLCETCGEVVNGIEIPALGHVPGEPTVVLEPNERQPGLMVVVCTECAATMETTVLPILTE